MRYHFKHLTRFIYHRPVRETVMELRMHPITDALQQCHSLLIELEPFAHLFRYEDHLGNIIHHFDIPEQHDTLTVNIDGEVEVHAPPPWPPSLPGDAWKTLDDSVATEDLYEMLSYGTLTQPTPSLARYAEGVGCSRSSDPLSFVRYVNHRLYEDFEYAPDSTRVDSAIDEALDSRRGVCQDFAHIMVTLLRMTGVPTRYVSGYLYSGDAGQPSPPQASHAWVEAWLPTLGWVGFDPTHDRPVDDRYIRNAVGREYLDVPPTRGVFKGETTSELHVGVIVSPGTLYGVSKDVPIGWRSSKGGATAVLQHAEQ